MEETFDALTYKMEIENQLYRKIKRIRSNRDDEYILFNDDCIKVKLPFWSLYLS